MTGLSYVQVTGTWADSSGSPVSGTVTFTPSQTVYASGLPLVTPGVPVTAQVSAGVLRSASGGAVQLLATDNAGLSIQGGSSMWFWTAAVAITSGVSTEKDSWDFPLPYSAQPVDLYATKNLVPASWPNPMTAPGDMIAGGALGSAERIPGNSSAAREFLVSQGTGSAAQVPSFGALQAGDVPALPYAPLASPALTGTPTAPTATPLTDDTQVATTAYTDAAVAVEASRAATAEALKAPLASPALTGSPTAPTQTSADNSTKLATTAFVAAAAGTALSGAETYAAGAASAAQAAAIAASLPALAQASVSASGTLALDTISTVTAATALTMTLPASVAGALIVAERESASVASVAVTGNIRGVAAQTVTLSLASESETFFGYGGSWWPIAGHKTLASLQALFAAFAGDVAGGVPAAPRVQLSDPSGGAWGLGVSDSAGHLMTLQLVQDQSGNPLQDQSGQPLGMPDTLTVGTPSKPYGLAVGQGGCTVPVGLAGHHDDDLQMSSDTSTSMSYRQFWPLSDPQCGAVLPVFAWPLGNPSDMDGTGPLTVACSIECDDGTVLPFYFGGSRTLTLTAQDGRLVTADYPIAFGKQVTGAGVNGFGTLSGVWLRVYVSQSASRSDSVTTVNGSPAVADTSILATDLNRNVSGTGIPGNCRVGSPLTPGTSFTLVNAGTSYATVNATASGTVTADISNIIPLNIGAGFVTGSSWNGPNGGDLTPQGTVFSGNGSFAGMYGPVLLLGRPPAARVPIVAQISDSIFNGTTDAFLGPVQRGAIALGYPLVKLSRFSAFAGDWSTTVGCRYRRKLVPGCTHAVVELGTNDGLQSMGSATGLQTKILAIGAWLSALGVKAWLCTVCPRSTSTDNWATLANQTITYPASVLSYFNSWVRSVPAGDAGYIELGNLVSSAADSGKWAVNGTANYSSADGTHPSSAFMTGPIAAAVLSAMSAWTVV